MRARGPYRRRLRRRVPPPERAVSRGRLLYVVADRLDRRAVVPALDAMLERQTWDAGRLREETRRRIRAQIDHAVARVPFYRRLGFQGAPPLEALPLIGRDDLRREGEALRAPEVPLDRLEAATSGGSTGVPVTVWLDAQVRDAQMAGVLRAQTWMALPFVTRHALLWGPPPDVVTYGTFRGWLRGLPIRRSFYATFALSEAGTERLRRVLRRRAFPQVVGYSSALDRVASGAEALPRPARAVVASAEPLFPAQRRRIERFFGAPVFERYGCNEFAAIAHQCRAGSLHVLSDRVVLEILDPAGRPVPPGAIGEAVVSDLDNQAMPLLRYRQGDAIEAGGACSCPLPFPVIAAVHGRMADLLEGTGGAVVSPRHVAQALASCGEVLEHQLRLARDGLTCLVRPLGAFDAGGAAAALARLLGREVRVRPAATIERWPSGKVRPVVRDADPT
jgi:phenylacetate-CoA ligase